MRQYLQFLLRRLWTIWRHQRRRSFSNDTRSRHQTELPRLSSKPRIDFFVDHALHELMLTFVGRTSKLFSLGSRCDWSVLNEISNLLERIFVSIKCVSRFSSVSSVLMYAVHSEWVHYIIWVSSKITFLDSSSWYFCIWTWREESSKPELAKMLCDVQCFMNKLICNLLFATLFFPERHDMSRWHPYVNFILSHGIACFQETGKCMSKYSS